MGSVQSRQLQVLNGPVSDAWQAALHTFIRSVFANYVATLYQMPSCCVAASGHAAKLEQLQARLQQAQQQAEERLRGMQAAEERAAMERRTAQKEVGCR